MVAVTDASGAVTHSYAYDPYGVTTEKRFRRLVKLTPTGFEALAGQDADLALRLLAEANEHVEPITLPTSSRP